MVINDGFGLVRVTIPALKAAKEELFVDKVITSALLTKTSAAVKTTATVTASNHGLKVGDIITIFGSLVVDLNDDVGRVITAVTTNTFNYLSLDDATHTSVSVKVRVLNPYVLTNEDISDTLQTFVHLSVSNTVLSVLEVTRNNQDYIVLANDEKLIGDVFRSITLKQGDSFNARFQEETTVRHGTLVQEN